MIISDIIQKKDKELIFCHPGDSIIAAVKKMAGGKVGAILVADEKGEPVGIFTERDLIRLVADKYNEMKDIKIGDIMTKEVVIGYPQDSIDKLKTIMTEKRLRHIPIMDNGRLVGIVSIGDLVKASLTTTESDVHLLKDYISGKYQ